MSSCPECLAFIAGFGAPDLRCDRHAALDRSLDRLNELLRRRGLMLGGVAGSGTPFISAIADGAGSTP